MKALAYGRGAQEQETSTVNDVIFHPEQEKFRKSN